MKPRGLFAVIPVLAAVGLAAQQQPPIFRGGVNIVRTDVTVLGSDGRPVHGLTIDDFDLFEDGERLPILGFAEVNLPDASDAPPWMRDTTTDVRSALDGRVFVFLLDDGQIPYTLEMGAGYVQPSKRIEAINRIIDQFLNRMGPNDVAAVICTYNQRCDQNFTSDRTRIRAAVEKFNPISVPPPNGVVTFGDPVKASAGMSASITKYLTGLSSRRRTIIYITPSEPIRPELTSYYAWTPRELTIVAAFKEAMRAGITVYSLNPNSMVSLADTPPDDPDSPQSPRQVKFRSAPRSLSLETGGFNVSRIEDFAEGVDQIFRETGSYYLLGYEPPPKKDTGFNMIGGLRELKVHVNRPDVTIKAHRGYIATTEPKPAANPPPPSSAALAGVLPKTDLPLRIAAAPFAVPGQSEAVVALTLGVVEPAVDSRTHDRLDVQVRAFSSHGDERAVIRHQVDAWLSRTRDRDAVIDVVAELRLKPGTYAIRAAATSERLGTSGSVYTDVVVPDFSAAPLTLSGVVVVSVPAPDSVLPLPLSEIIPARPTTNRDVSRTAIVRAFVRVYQGGKQPLSPVLLTTTIVDQKNNAVVTRAESLNADRFGATRTADIHNDLPVADLETGWYRLRYEVGIGTNTASRDVQIRIH